MIAKMQDKGKIFLGKLNNYLEDTLDVIFKKGRITAMDFSEIRKLEANTSGTRLLNLYKKRLAKRVDEVVSNGRVWVYEEI